MFSVSDFIFSKLPGLLRLSNWWHYKIPPLIAIFFFAQIISGEETSRQILLKLLLLIVWMFAAASFGYFVNDWSDIEEDALAYKKNAVTQLSPLLRWLTVSFLFSIVLLVQFFLNGIYSIPFILSVFQLFLFLTYSVKPIRFKRYLLSGIFCDSLYAHVLTAAIVFTSVCSASSHLPLLFMLCAWQFTGGIRNILLHHLFDRKNDARSGNSNLTIRFGPVCILKIINRILMPLDIFLVLLFFSFVSVQLVYVFLVLVLFRLFLVHFAWRNRKLWLNKKLSYWLINDLHEGYIPFISILLFSLSSLKIFIVLCFIYPFVYPQFIPGLTNDVRHLFNYLKSRS